VELKHEREGKKWDTGRVSGRKQRRFVQLQAGL
jgi:hypothetical protein